MGESIRWSISVDEETEQIGDSLQAEFAPIVGDNRSRLVQMIFKSWHRLGFTMETLAAALSQAQRIKLANAAQEITTLNNLSQPEFPSAALESQLGPKPLRRINASEGTGASQRKFRSVSQRRAVGAGVRLAYMPHFPGKVSPIKSNSYVSARVA